MLNFNILKVRLPLVLLSIVLFIFLLASCNSTKTTTPKGVIIAETSYITSSSVKGCSAGINGAIKYRLGLVSKITSQLIRADKTGQLCGTDGESGRILVKNGIYVKVVAKDNSSEVSFCQNGGVYVTIAQYESSTSDVLLAPFHTNKICYGADNNTTGENVIIKPVPNPDDPEEPLPDPDDAPITVVLTEYPAVVDTDVQPMYELNSLFGSRSNIVSVGNEIHFLNGFKQKSDTGRYVYSDTHYSYNITSNTWKNIGIAIPDIDKPGFGFAAAMGDVAVTSDDGKFYMYGGSQNSNNFLGVDSRAVYYFDTTKELNDKPWQTAVSSTVYTFASAVAIIGNRLYAYGGSFGSNTTVGSSIFIYMDITESPIVQRPVAYGNNYHPTPRLYHQAVAIGSKIYFYGGLAKWSFDAALNPVPVNDISDPFIYYDTVDNNFHKILNPPSKVRARFSLIALDNEHLFISSGQGANNTSVLKSYVYNINTGKTYEIDDEDMPWFATQATAPEHGYDNAWQRDYALAYYVKSSDGAIHIFKARNVKFNDAPEQIEHYKLDITIKPNY